MVTLGPVICEQCGRVIILEVSFHPQFSNGAGRELIEPWDLRAQRFKHETLHAKTFNNLDQATLYGRSEYLKTHRRW
jgi:hypothetical protein